MFFSKIFFKTKTIFDQNSLFSGFLFRELSPKHMSNSSFKALEIFRICLIEGIFTTTELKKKKKMHILTHIERNISISFTASQQCLTHITAKKTMCQINGFSLDTSITICYLGSLGNAHCFKKIYLEF